MRRIVIAPAIAACTLLLAACGDSRGGADPTAAVRATVEPSATVAAPPPEATSTATAPVAVTITVEASPEAFAGSQFTATVRIDGASNLGAYQLTPAFDSAGLRLISVQDGGFLASTGRQPSCQTAPAPTGGTTLYCVTTGAQPPGPSGSGTLATITLQTLANGTFDVSVDQVLVLTPDGTEAPVTVAATMVTVR